MRAFVFTVDSLIALALALFAISAMLYVAGSQRTSASSLERIYLIADDSMDVLGGVKAVSASQEALSDKETALESIGRLVSKGDSEKARASCEKILEPIVPEQFGFSLEYEKNGDWIPVYSRKKGINVMVASSVRVVFGSKNPGEKKTWCESENCPFCKGLPPGNVEGDSYGPLLMRVRVWN